MSDIEIVNIQPQFAKQLRQLQLICFPTVPPDELFHEEEFVEMCSVFPDGTFVALDGDKVVGLGAGFYTNFSGDHTMEEMTDKGHDPNGLWYYGTDISVHTEWRGRGIGSKLYAARKAVVRRDNKKGIFAGGFIPNFANYKHEMNVETYIQKVVAGEIYDPTLSFQMRHGFEVQGIIKDYMTIGNSDGYATKIVWRNPDYKSDA